MNSEDFQLEAVPLEELDAPEPTQRNSKKYCSPMTIVASILGAILSTTLMYFLCEDTASCLAWSVILAITALVCLAISIFGEDARMASAAQSLAWVSLASALGGLCLFLYIH